MAAQTGLATKDNTRVTDDAVSYAYKPSLIAKADQFVLISDGLSWRVRGRSGVWVYTDIAAVRLSYRPISMQQRRFRADITHRSGASIAIVSTSWQTASLMTPQDDSYRIFIVDLHRRMAEADGTALLTGGLRRWIYLTAVVLLGLVALAMAALLLRALWIGEWAGALFLVAFAALFAWQTGGFVWRNTPRPYAFDAMPKDLLP